MLEEHEEVLERWYFTEYSRGTDKDLQEFFCIEKLQGMSYCSLQLLGFFCIEKLRGMSYCSLQLLEFSIRYSVVLPYFTIPSITAYLEFCNIVVVVQMS